MHMTKDKESPRKIDHIDDDGDLFEPDLPHSRSLASGVYEEAERELTAKLRHRVPLLNTSTEPPPTALAVERTVVAFIFSNDSMQVTTRQMITAGITVPQLKRLVIELLGHRYNVLLCPGDIIFHVPAHFGGYVYGDFPLLAFDFYRSSVIARQPLLTLEIVLVHRLVSLLNHPHSSVEQNAESSLVATTTRTTHVAKDGKLVFTHTHTHLQPSLDGQVSHVTTTTTTEIPLDGTLKPTNMPQTENQAMRVRSPSEYSNPSMLDDSISESASISKAAQDSSSKRWIRGVVSKKKVRYTEDGYDLDLTYITPRVIAMGFPSEGSEGIYRNPMEEVQRFFAQRHGTSYKIYNLCSERAYPPEKFQGEVVRFPFDDHNPPPFYMMRLFCEDVDKFLKSTENAVVAVHCKAGKGRTGLMISAYLMYSKHAVDAEDALRKFGDVRTENGKGVTIPSQIRYVHYFQQALAKPVFPTERQLVVQSITLITTPHFDRDGGCDPYYYVYSHQGKKYCSKDDEYPKHYINREQIVLIPRKPVILHGDIKFCFFDHDKVGSDDAMFHFWLNTAFVPADNTVRLPKLQIDRACKDKGKEFDARFEVEVKFVDPFGGR
eukprot:TRINITY_DN9723_c0_g1_i1.p1 TRINITY_DN9723_c0_g1~~TRINITY_DN9723_c0_g1_i1.p1  ORF type:complete len:605 (+),score=97.54 TRINITY_DN9723_c0_g1_i1:2083-3897(+)